ncbi:hypothetical protein H0H87_008206 [Tephrocybe sp. NHM501043]|nr:hypothetical protein H0H87_008206 [Tephrocybe sp. NHM501043]
MSTQKLIDVHEEKAIAHRHIFYDNQIAQEVPSNCLGKKWKGYTFHVTSSNDKQDFPIKQGVFLPCHVCLLRANSHSCSHTCHAGKHKHKSVHGSIIDPDIAILSLVIVRQGEKDNPGLTDNVLPKRLGPKRATKISSFFNLGKEDDVRNPKVQCLITPLHLQCYCQLHSLRHRHIKHQKEQKAKF